MQIQNQIKYYSRIAWLFLPFIFAGCNDEQEISGPGNESHMNSYLKKLEYEIISGDEGVHDNAAILENGEVVLSHTVGGNKYVIITTLPGDYVKSIHEFLLLNKIQDLASEYKAPGMVLDGMEFNISYISSVSFNRVYAESGGKFPVQLENIIERMREVSAYIKSKADYGTLRSVWNRKDIIKSWKFPEIKLEKKVYMYNALSNATEIQSYFTQIKKSIGYNIIYWDHDSLFNIYDGGNDYGYFNVHEVFPIKLWSGYFQKDISVVQNEGIVLSTAEWQKMDLYLNNQYVFVTDKLTDNGNAIRLILIPGEPYKN